MDEEKEKKRKEDDLIHAGLSGASAETVQRFGAAVKEHCVAYTGVDQENGQKLAKGLKSIAESKVNPDTAKQNLNQQAGFAAEVKTQARERAEQIISKKTDARSTRTDDMKTQSDGKGNTIGGKNDQLYDIADISPDGSYIKGSGRQLKYVGEDPKDCCSKLLEKKMDKYRDNDVQIEIPEDFYDDVVDELKSKAETYRQWIENAEARGNYELAEKHRARLKKIEKTLKMLRKGKVTKQEAREARTNPMKSTAKDVVKLSHRAGVESAKISGVVGGSVSIVRNLVAVVKDEKEPDEAVLSVAKDTATAAVVGYGTGFTGAAIKGVMQNAKNSSVRALSKTNLPGTLVTVALTAESTMKDYFDKKITGVECFERLGEQGTGMISSAMFAAIGQAIVPVPVLGGMIGGMIGYAVASASYGVLLNTLKEQKMAEQERARIEYECRQHQEMMQQYRREMETTINRYLSTNIQTFHTAFNEMKEAMNLGDADGFIISANSITTTLGKQPLISSGEDFDRLMMSKDPIKI